MRTASLLLIAAVLSPAACAHYSQEDGEKLSGEVFAIQTQARSRKKELDDKLDAISSQLDELNRSSRRDVADLGAQLDNMMEQVARVRGLAERLEALETKVNELQDQFRSLDERTSLKSEEDKAKAVQEALERERLLSQPAQLMEAVLGLLNAQQTQEARTLLREFQKRAEGNRALKKHSDDAQFLIAESYFIEGKYQLAATEYNNLRKEYSSSPKIPEALYKMGMCFEKLNLPDDAKLFYETLIKKHRRSSAAKKAKDRLKALK